MKIGSRVVVKTDCYMPVELAGRKGTIIDERIPDSHAAMLSGISKFVVRFDEWINLGTNSLRECAVPSNALMLENELDEIEEEREEFLKTIDVKVLDNTQNAESFSAIIDSRRGIVIK